MASKKKLQEEIANLRDRVATLESELSTRAHPQVVLTMNGQRLDAALSRAAMSRCY